MSEANETQEREELEEQQEAPAMRERATGPLVPRWFKVVFYLSFGALCLAAVAYVSHSFIVQRRVTGAVETIVGGLERHPSSLESGPAQEALRTLKRHPRDSFLYCNQELVRDEVTDPRMARALALRRAIEWGTISTRRNALRKVAAAMGEEGRVDAAALDEQTIDILREMVQERRGDPEMTYAQRRITEVMDWLVKGAETQPTGVEKRRVQSLLAKYEKKQFVAEDAAALLALMEKWSTSAKAVQREAAGAFQKMLEGEKTSLSPEGAELCARRADHWEGLYRQGMELLSKTSTIMLGEILEQDIFLDHPHIYQFITLLGDRFDKVRENISDGLWMLRHNYFGARFISRFASRTRINPVMAVETVRLTREEHERIMRAANDRRMQECTKLLIRIGMDYVKNKSRYDLHRAEDPDEFMQKYVIHTLELLAEDERVADLIEDAMPRLREADQQRPGGPVLF